MDNKEIIKAVADNPILAKALKDLIAKYFTFDYGVNTKMTNESLGQVTRANVEGLKKIEQAFKEIENFKTVASQEGKPNPAR